MNWNHLIDESALAELLPGDYAGYSRALKEGLVIFLAGLPPSWQHSAIARQLELGPAASLPERLGALARECPVLHKLGQVVARDQRLAAALREHLRPLESSSPTIGWETVVATIQEELGPTRQLGIELDSPPVAEGSVAVVVGFRQEDPTELAGVFKVLKPGIEERLARELELLFEVGIHLDAHCEALGIAELDYAEVFDQVRLKLASEVDLAHEQGNIALAAAQYAGCIHVQIPQLAPSLCTPRVTAMERIVGVKVTDHDHRLELSARRLAHTVVRALVANPLLAADDAAMFHCDPHAGNLLWTDDRRLAILDWSLVTHLAEWERILVVRLMLAVLMFDREEACRLIEQLVVRGEIRSDALRNVVAAWMGRYRNGEFPGVQLLTGMMDDAALEASARFSPEMMLFRKSMLTLESVVRDVSGGMFHLDEALVPELLLSFVSELPTRWMAPPDSRQFATRISNHDLLAMVAEAPAAARRFFRGQ